MGSFWRWRLVEDSSTRLQRLRGDRRGEGGRAKAAKEDDDDTADEEDPAVAAAATTGNADTQPSAGVAFMVVSQNRQLSRATQTSQHENPFRRNLRLPVQCRLDS